jgi:hypothetical protein
MTLLPHSATSPSLGMVLMMGAFTTFSFTLLLHAAALRTNQAHGRLD